MQYELHIQKQDIIELEQHAENQLPREAVALLFGEISGNIIRVNQVELVQNEAKTNLTTFSVNPEHEYKLLTMAEERGESLVCIYHSHPAPPGPSETDLKNMRLNPVVWLISSKLTGDWVTKAHILQDEEAVEINVRYLDSIDSHL